MYEDAEEDEKPEAHKELASLVIANAEERISELIASVHPCKYGISGRILAEEPDICMGETSIGPFSLLPFQLRV
jgi:hypothetical protein